MNLSIKNVPENLVEQLRIRAKRNHRSLQGELLNILELTVRPQRLNMNNVRNRLEILDFQTGEDAAIMIREDRDGR